MRVERRDFAQALRGCAEELKPRSRLVWFLRIFCSMSSKEIAVHPEVKIKASHVDVLMQRARDAVRDCMRRKGYKPQDMPPGTFVEIWKTFRMSGHVGAGSAAP
jgi:DNA-directed RNA polymerase specialized sigma24 family protein